MQYAALLLACACCTAIVHATETREAFGVLVENDAFLGKGEDGNYTGGFSFSYESDALHKYRAEQGFARWSAWRRHLPGFRPSRDERMRVALSGLAFTPETIEVKEPLPDEPPYMGAVAADVQLTSRGTVDQHTYSFRLGWVGPSTHMGDLQESIHKLTGSDDPQGWGNQLPDEPIVNVSYAYTRRVKSGVLGSGWQWDVAPGTGVSVGNYFTGANASLFLRVGRNLSNSFGVTSIDSGVHGSRNVIDLPGDEWRYQFSLGVAGFAVAHYMPLDGTVFKESPSIDHDDILTVASAGVAVGKGNLQLDLLYNAWSDAIDGTVPRSRYAGMYLTWFL